MHKLKTKLICLLIGGFLIAFAACNDTKSKSDTAPADSANATKMETPAPAAKDSMAAPKDTTKMDTANTKPIKTYP